MKAFFRFIKNNKSIVLLFIVLFVILYYGVFGAKGLMKKNIIQRENDSLSRIIEYDSIEGTLLSKEVFELKNSDIKLEQIAREKFGLTKEKEKIYKIIIDSNK